ncbi:hypothetical protein V3C99_002937, partial [Haemonchus contortus]
GFVDTNDTKNRDEATSTRQNSTGKRRTLAPLATTTTTTTANASMTLSSGASRAPSARDRRATSPRDETPKSIKRNKTTVLPACTRSFAGAHRRIRDNR